MWPNMFDMFSASDLFLEFILHFFCSDIEDPDPSASFVDDQPVTFEVVEDGSKRRAKKLVSSDGFAYTVKVNLLKFQ